MITTLQAWLKGAAAAILLAVTPLLPTSAAGADTCAPHETLTKFLADQYRERPYGMGLTSGGALLEVFISEKGTWTVVVSLPTGASCIVAEGTDWDGRILVAGPEA